MNIIDSIKASIFTPIHPAGIPFIAIFFILTVIIGWLWAPLYFAGIILTVWCIYFLEIPRELPQFCQDQIRIILLFHQQMAEL